MTKLKKAILKIQIRMSYDKKKQAIEFDSLSLLFLLLQKITFHRQLQH